MSRFDLLIEHSNPFSIILYVICGIMIILNLHGLFMMYKTIKSFSLEKYVLISGIIEIVLTIIHNLNCRDIFIDIIQILQILITLLISKKFLQFYLVFNFAKKIKNIENSEVKEKILQNGEDNGKNIYNFYFWGLAIFCAIIEIFSFIIDTFVDETHQFNLILDFINDGICFIISIILFIFSLVVSKIMSDLITEQYKENKLVNNDEEQKEYLEKNEIFLSTRKKQILCISLANLFTDFFEFVLSLLEAFVYKIPNGADISKLNIYDLLNEYSLWLSTFFNYVAFYFIVKNSFNINYVHITKNNENIIITKVLIENNKDEEEKVTNDIDEYLKENDDIPKKYRQSYPDDF